MNTGLNINVNKNNILKLNYNDNNQDNNKINTKIDNDIDDKVPDDEYVEEKIQVDRRKLEKMITGLYFF